MYPLRSSTATAALPIAGCWYSTRHVGNSATGPRSTFGAGVDRAGSRLRNHFENRTRWNVGNSRSRAIPVTFSIAYRAGPNLAVAFTIGASVVATTPC